MVDVVHLEQVFISAGDGSRADMKRRKIVSLENCTGPCSARELSPGSTGRRSSSVPSARWTGIGVR
jgi:hypothetical protein